MTDSWVPKASRSARRWNPCRAMLDRGSYSSTATMQIERAWVGSLATAGLSLDLARSRSEAESLLKSGVNNCLVVRLEGLSPGDLGFLVERRELDPWLPIVAVGSKTMCEDLGLSNTVTACLESTADEPALRAHVEMLSACAEARRQNVRLMRSIAELRDDRSADARPLACISRARGAASCRRRVTSRIGLWRRGKWAGHERTLLARSLRPIRAPLPRALVEDERGCAHGLRSKV